MADASASPHISPCVTNTTHPATSASEVPSHHNAQGTQHSAPSPTDPLAPPQHAAAAATHSQPDVNLRFFCTRQPGTPAPKTYWAHTPTEQAALGTLGPQQTPGSEEMHIDGWEPPTCESGTSYSSDKAHGPVTPYLSHPPPPPHPQETLGVVDVAHTANSEPADPGDTSYMP